MKIVALLYAHVLIVALTTIGVVGASEPVSWITKWAIQTEGPIRGATVVAGDAIYFGSSDGNLYAADKTTGDIRWKFATGGVIAGAPAIAGNLIIVAGRADRAYALDASTGQVRWSFQFQPDIPADMEWDYFTAAPVVDGQQVLIASGDGNLYALSLADGGLRWRFQTGDRIRATPLVVDGTVYAPSGDDFVYALAATDGTLQWKFATDGAKYGPREGFIRSDIFSRPSLQHGLLVFGSRDANVYAVDIATHEKAWSFNYDTTWAMSTVADDMAVYVGWSTNRMICALDLKTGAKRWEYRAGAHTYTTALLDGDDAIWGSADGRIYAFNRQTGALDWSYDAGSDIYSSLIRDGETLYFGADDGRLRALTKGPRAHRAVYRPPVPPGIDGFLIDEAIAPYLTERGYELLDSREALGEFVNTRIADGAPSAIVFAFVQIPVDVVGEDPAIGPLRRYLDSGGKVVWPWGLPNQYLFDAQGNFVRHDPTVGRRLLDVPFLRFEDGGNYYSKATQAGRNWGLPALGRTTWASLEPGADVTPLTIDEYGRVGAWVKSFHPRPGSGWVQVNVAAYGVRMHPDEIAVLDRIASYGLE